MDKNTTIIKIARKSKKGKLCRMEKRNFKTILRESKGGENVRELIRRDDR